MFKLSDTETDRAGCLGEVGTVGNQWFVQVGAAAKARTVAPLKKRSTRLTIAWPVTDALLFILASVARPGGGLERRREKLLCAGRHYQCVKHCDV